MTLRNTSVQLFAVASLAVCMFACGTASSNGGDGGGPLGEAGPGGGNDSGTTGAADGGGTNGAQLPLVFLADASLPGRATRFDYQDIDIARGHLIIAHLGDGEILIVDLKDGSVLGRVTNVPTARGVIVAADVGRIFATSSPDQLVIIDSGTFAVLNRVTTGNAPDGDGWDPTHKIVAVSDQADGALSLITNAGDGTRTQVPLGTETGNVVYDVARGWFWLTVVEPSPPDQLVAVDPTTAKVVSSIPLPGCDGAHGLRLHPDGQSAFVACEGNDMLARVDLGVSHAVALGTTGSGPDVLAIDPGLGWLYVAAESGDLTIFDVTQPGVALIGHDQPGGHAHSVAVDPATHRVFFPLLSGPSGTPVLRIVRPTGL